MSSSKLATIKMRVRAPTLAPHGFKDPREPESWNPKLKLVEEILLSKDLAKVPSKLRWYYRLQQHSRSWSRKGTIILHFSF
jgi:hypothetical protein